MNLKKNKSGFMQTPCLRKSMYVAVILLSWLFIYPTSAFAVDGIQESQAVNQQVTITGTVVDPTGEPIIGASVLVEGTSNGTITDLDGNFTLSVPSKATLVISYIGYATQKVTATSNMKITMKEDNELLDEVVVIGYGSVKRANLTGAVSSLNMKELEDVPTTNLTSTLMGTMPGVIVGEATGNPMGKATIKIRINGTWGSEEPLYVIDGFIRDSNAFDVIDPSEITSISILKDAAAAVYGVRGSGGVILVTTKRGKEGKTSISYSGSYGVSQGVSMPKMMSAWQQGTAINDMLRGEVTNGKRQVEAYEFFTDEELEMLKGVNHNWLDGAWKDAQNTRHTLNISGGTDKMKYFVGGSYMYSDGNFSNLNVNRLSFRSGVDVKFTNDLKGSINISFSSKDSKMPLNNNDKEMDRMYGTFSSLNRAPRWISPYIDGNPIHLGEGTSGDHPLAMLETGSYRKSRGDNVVLNGKLDYDVKWVKGLSASLSMSYSKDNSYGKQLSRPYTLYQYKKNQIPYGDNFVNGHFYSNELEKLERASNGDKLYESASFSYSYQINPQVSYKTKIGQHDIAGMYVFELAESGGNGMNITRSNMILATDETAGGFEEATAKANSSIDTKGRRLSHIGRANYSYADRYFFEGTLRYEASSNFSPGHRWGLFYSLSGAWRISEETWFKENVSFIDNLKIRASYGRLGNDKVSLKQWRQSYSKESGFNIGTENGSPVLSLYPAMNGLLVYDSTWEKSDSYNVGLDLRFTNGISFGIDGFFRKTFDILDAATSIFPQSAGITGETPKLNYGIQEAWGGELEIGYQKSLNKDWSINLKGNLSYASNKVVKKYQNPGIAGTWQDEEGRMRGGETGYRMWKGKNGKGDGLARTWQDVYDYIDYLKGNLANPGVDVISVHGKKEEDLRPGMLMFEDIGKTLFERTPDGIIDTAGDEYIISKYDNPPYNFGFTLGFSWKDFSFSALFSGSFGNDVVFDKGFYTEASGGGRSGKFLTESSNNLAEWFGNYAICKEDGSLVNPNAKYPRLDDYSFRQYRSEFWMRDGFNLRLRTINLSYSIPQTALKSIGVNSCRVFFTGTNLWTIVNPYPYKDAYVGFWSDYPQVRTFNFGINISL